MLRISSYALDFFVGVFLSLLLLAVLVRVLHAKVGEYVGLFELIKEMIFAFIFSLIFIVYIGFDYSNQLVLWIFVSGFILGLIQSFSVDIFFSKNIYNIKGRHFFAIFWGIMVALMELSFIFYPEYLRIIILFSILNTGILLGLNLALVFRGLRLRKIINIF